ncbi:MAG: hypothetical protein QOI49_311, partial [Verrucomicrobiota bacterium]
ITNAIADQSSIGSLVILSEVEESLTISPPLQRRNSQRCFDGLSMTEEGLWPNNFAARGRDFISMSF